MSAPTESDPEALTAIAWETRYRTSLRHFQEASDRAATAEAKLSRIRALLRPDDDEFLVESILGVLDSE